MNTTHAPSVRADLEAQLGGYWLHMAGLLLVFLGTSFFLKVAFDHNWVEPAYRVALGVTAGALLIAYARRLAAKGNTYFSEGITALGAGVEFLSLYSSNALFHLATPGLVLLGMVAVNAAIAVIAWRDRSTRLAVLTAIGGFGAPLLAGVNANDPWMLAVYLVTLNSGLLVLGDILKARFLAPASLVITLLYASSCTWALDDVQKAQIFALLYGSFAVWGWVRAKLDVHLDPVSSATSGGALAIALLQFESALQPQHRTLLAATMLGLTALHLAAGAAFKSKLHTWFAALALTLAIPAALDGIFVNLAWSIEAVILAIAGRRRDDVLRGAAILLLVVDLLWTIGHYVTYAPPMPLWNERFGASLALIAAAYFVNKFAFGDAGTEIEITLTEILRVGQHVIALLTASLEAWNGVQHFGGTAQGSSVALSVVAAAFATALISGGLRKRDALLRWEGLGLIVVTAAKVLIFDMSALDISYRVISAVLVGFALIGVSYAYQRRAKALPQP